MMKPGLFFLLCYCCPITEFKLHAHESGDMHQQDSDLFPQCCEKGFGTAEQYGSLTLELLLVREGEDGGESDSDFLVRVRSLVRE